VSFSKVLSSRSPHPFETFIVKVASRCNLNCSYCYEYNKEDSTWRDSSRFISEQLVKATALRIAEHAVSHSLSHVAITAHGGEPLLAGADRLDHFYSTMREVIPESISTHFGIQTNAALLDASLLEIFHKHRVSVGVSLDGPPRANRFRVDHAGRASYIQTVEGVQRLKAFKNGLLFAGFLAVIDPTSDPIEVFEHLAGFLPRSIDFLEHFATHDHPPTWHKSGETLLGDWMLRVFHHWINNREFQNIKVRVFEDALSLWLGGSGRSEWFGLAPVAIIVVSVDGSIENTDVLKIVGTEGRVLDLNVARNSFDEALLRSEIQLRQGGVSSLCDECQKCPIVTICGGGYFPTRYKRSTGYLNPTVYCKDLTLLLRGIRKFVCDNLSDNQRTRVTAASL
jgi:radical SAM/SPASM domain FxsB family protein